ncbi:MAG: hypothetical protein M9962_04545 [Oligoflexia bacterium]|nr:hypothetical protein [Oligoflexia bacterium]
MQFHQSWPPEAREYLSNAIQAHGGWHSWEKVESIHFKLKILRGALVFAKGLGRTFFAPETFRVSPKQRKVEFFYKNSTDIFENGKIIYSPEKKIIEDGRLIFKKTTIEQWYPEHAAYFFGYAWTNYISYPFILLNFELLSFKIYNNRAAIFKIRFPHNFHTHSREQTFYFNQEHMLYRHDYRARLAGPFVFGAHFTQEYVLSNDIQIGFIRKVRPRIGPLVLPTYGIYGEIEVLD